MHLELDDETMEISINHFLIVLLTFFFQNTSTRSMAIRLAIFVIFLRKFS